MANRNITDQLTDERVALMLDDMLPTIYSQVERQSVLLGEFESTPYKEERNGGARIRSPLRTGKNTSFKTFGRGATMTPQIYPSAMFAYWNYKQGAGDIMIDWVEEREHAGGNQDSVVELLTLRIDDLIDSVREEINTMLWNSAVGNAGMDMNGLQLLVPTDPRTGIIAGLDRALNIWWRNTYWDNNASGFAYGKPPHDTTLGAPAAVGAFGDISDGASDGLKRMGTMLNNCAQGENMSDYSIITEQFVYEQYEALAQHAKNFRIAYSQDDRIVKYNFGGALFRGVPILFDTVTNGAPSGQMRFLNKKYIKLITDSQAWFKWSDEKSPVNQFTRVRFLMLRGQLILLKPVTCAVLQGITAWQA